MTGELQAFMEGLLPRVEDTLDRLLPDAEHPPERLHEAMRYSVFAGGKRIRPALVVLAGETLGASRQGLLPWAAAVELVHTFSLVHDDLPALDDDDLRRGRPTVHREYDEATAILVGDALLNLGLHVLLREPAGCPLERRARAAELAMEAVGTRGMIGGQAGDLEAEAEWPADPPRALESIHRRKTGALIEASVRLGGIYAGASREDDDALGRLGARLGLMFQVADDILDVEGSARVLGKTARKDLRARKLTYPALYGLDASKALLVRFQEEALELIGRWGAGDRGFAALIDYLVYRDR